MNRKKNQKIGSTRGKKPNCPEFKGYNALVSNYERAYGRNPAQKAAIEWLVQRLSPGDWVLDVGSGDGIMTAKFLTGKGVNVLGIDNSSEMIRKARQNAPKAVFLNMNIKRLKLDRHGFQAITAFFSLLHIQKSIFRRTIENLVNELEPEGIFLFSMVEGNVDGEGLFLGQRMYFSAFSKEELEKILIELGLDIIDTKVTEFQPRLKDAEPETQFFFYTKLPTKT